MAVRDNRGWHLNPDARVGDPAFTLAAAWRATITAPSRLAIASTGSRSSDRVVGGRRTVVVGTQHARDFAFAIGPMSERSIRVNGAHIRVFSSAATARSTSVRALSMAAKAFRTYETWYGTYGAADLDVVIVNLPYGGIEYPEIVFSAPDKATVAHELAHQWFYGIVGDDQYRQPWLDESFASWNEEQFVPGTYPCNPKDPLGRHRGQLGLGLAYFEHHPNAYSDVIYRGGSCALTALKMMLGRPRFLSMLREEVARYRYGVIRTPDFLRLLGETNSAVARRWRDLVGL
jgi:aminopeptidase N